MRSIFISHSRSDAERASQLVDVLEKEGLEVSKKDSLLTGSDWQAEILSAIKRCSALVAFIDNPTPNVMLELGYALGAAKQVLLVGGRDARIPFDVASLPIAHFDEGDTGSLFAIAEQLRTKANVDAPPDREFTDIRDQLAQMVKDSDYLEQVSAQQFEYCVLAFLQELGFEAVQTPATREAGYDILAMDPFTSFQAAVEVRKYGRNSVVGVSIVRQLVGAMMLSDVPCAILLSTNVFSASARSLAQKAPRPIMLMTLEELLGSTRESITMNASEGVTS